IELPKSRAVFCTQRYDTAVDAARVAACRSDDDLAVSEDRFGRDPLGKFDSRDGAAPDFVTGLGVERYDAAVAERGVDVALVDDNAAAHLGTLAVLVELGLVAPDLLSVGGIERQHGVRRTDVEDAVVDDRRELTPAAEPEVAS